MYYTKLKVVCLPEFSEILIAELSDIGFNTFEEVQDGIEAYAEDESYDRTALDEIKKHYSTKTVLVFQFEKVERRNWNEEWEKNFHPLVVEDKCLVRANFHPPDPRYPFEIIITPKMSFGTGHHQTTYLMLKTQMDLDHMHKRVMDAGCGTAILSIMAAKLGAHYVDAFDIDEWCVMNGMENIEVNECKNIKIQKGSIQAIEFVDKYDIILANINKNVLLEELGHYVNLLNPNGQLLMSGFYESDIPDLLKEASNHGKNALKIDKRDNWALICLA